MKRKHDRVPGYIRLGRRYVSLPFLSSVLLAVLAFGVSYALILHPSVMHFWYSRQALPEFSTDSPYLADYTGKARLFSPDGTLLYEGMVTGTVITGEGRLYQSGTLLYRGGFLDNKYHGTGTLYAPDGSIAFQGKFIEGEPVIETDEPVFEPSRRLDPLSLFGLPYMDVLTELTLDSVVYKEQPLEEQHLVLDEAGGVVYSFSLDAAGLPGILEDVYLCGLASAGGFVVGMSAGGVPSVSAVTGTAELFALGLSNMYWGKDTQALELEEYLSLKDGRVAAVFFVPDGQPAHIDGMQTKSDDPHVSGQPVPAPEGGGRIVFIRVRAIAREEP